MARNNHAEKECALDELLDLIARLIARSHLRQSGADGPVDIQQRSGAAGNPSKRRRPTKQKSNR